MNATVVAAIIAASVSAITLIGTLIAQYLGRRATSRELDRTFTEQRTRTLNERFATAADRLGSDKPPAVQLAGVYAMAVLADDWEKNRQTCVDVLCAYLRMPYEPDPGGDASAKEQRAFRASREVRHTVIRVITAHLRDDAVVSWQGLNFDFTGVVFDGGDFDGAHFRDGKASFRRARFPSGWVTFRDATFDAEVSFRDAAFSGGRVTFGSAKFVGGTVSFIDAEVSGGEVSFTKAAFSGSDVNFARAAFSDGEVNFGNAEFSGSKVGFQIAIFSGSEVSFTHAAFSDGEVNFGAVFRGGAVSFAGAFFSGSKVGFIGAGFRGGEVRFAYAVFSGGWLDFTAASFSGTRVDFTGEFPGQFRVFVPRVIRDGVDISVEPPGPVSLRPKFSGGLVNFRGAEDWSVPPLFPWTDAPPPGVTLPEKEDQSSGEPGHLG